MRLPLSAGLLLTRPVPPVNLDSQEAHQLT
jgi:hypothetical protein